MAYQNTHRQKESNVHSWIRSNSHKIPVLLLDKLNHEEIWSELSNDTRNEGISITIICKGVIIAYKGSVFFFLNGILPMIDGHVVIVISSDIEFIIKKCPPITKIIIIYYEYEFTTTTMKHWNYFAKQDKKKTATVKKKDISKRQGVGMKLSNLTNIRT